MVLAVKERMMAIVEDFISSIGMNRFGKESLK